MTKQELEAIIAEYAERYDPLITLDEAGAITHVPLGTIYAWSSAGHLDDFKQRCGRHVSLGRDAFARFNRQLLKKVTTNITVHKNGTGKYNRTDEEILDEDLHVAIFKTAISPHWYVRYNHPAQGQQKKSLRTKNKKEAKRKGWEIVVKLRSGELEAVRRRSPTVEDVARSFLTDRERIGRKPGTIKQYRCSPERFCKFCSDHGVARLDQLTPTHMMQYESQFREKGIALKKDRKTRGAPAKPNKSSSVHEKVKLVKSLTKWAVAWKLLATNPISGYRLPADSKADVHCYTPAEVAAICRHADCGAQKPRHHFDLLSRTGGGTC